MKQTKSWYLLNIYANEKKQKAIAQAISRRLSKLWNNMHRSILNGLGSNNYPCGQILR
jgi:hypothetical protein